MATKGWSFGALVAALKGSAFTDVATDAQMAAGVSRELLPSVAAVMSMFNKRDFQTTGGGDFIRIPDVPGGLIIQFGVTPSYLPNTVGVYRFSHILKTPFPNRCLAVSYTTAGGALPNTSFANTDTHPFSIGPIKAITGYVQNLRGDQGVVVHYIAIGY